MGTNLWDVWERAETGEICPVRKFEIDVYYKRLSELIKEYQLEYNPENIVPTDNSLMDDVFNAALELVIDVGVLCLDTERIIKFEESEIKKMLKTAPKEAVFGQGKDSVTVKHRNLEDKSPPVVRCGPMATPISEDIAIQIYQTYAMEPMTSILNFGTPLTLMGMKIRPNSPSELQAEVTNVISMRIATNRAGRPGMPITGSSAVSVAADIGSSLPEYGYRKGDNRCVWLLPQMKTDYAGLTRALHCMHYGFHIMSWGAGHIGGLCGGPEGAVVTSVAETLVASLLYKTTWNFVETLDIIHKGSSSRKAVWSTCLANAAINKNTQLITNAGSYAIYAGPCTDMCLYEIAVMTIGPTVVGANITGVAPYQGSHLDYCTGMEGSFLVEVAHAATTLKREYANDIIKTIITKYEDRIKKREIPAGKKFQECFDVTSLTPSTEYTELVRKIKKELEDLGLEFGWREEVVQRRNV